MTYPPQRVYCISYDLRTPGKDYTRLIDALKNVGPWWHYLESTWLIKTPSAPGEVWDQLSQSIDRNDLMLIIEVSRNYHGWLPQEAWDWIKANVA